MKTDYKLLTALTGVVIGLLNTPLWLTLLMLVVITGLLADGFLKAAIFLKKKQSHCKRLYEAYKRKNNHSDWPDKKPDLPMLEFKDWKWWKR